ncbi:MAG: hypothetical protein HY820_02685 [Acidobacteria bacterium]|nr:hypothetical protein [Acidobacteriota bacterium]
MKRNLFSAIPLILTALGALPQTVPAAGVPGAIFTTNSVGAVVNANLYDSKCAVYLDGGPGPNAPARAAGLPDGEYYFQVTDPSGATLLSTDPVSNRKFRVTGGVITAYTGTGGSPHPTGVDQDHSAQGAITIRLANGNCPTDFANTPNVGNVYKAWVTPVTSYVGNPANVDNPCSGGCFHGFVASQSKTDNFKALSAPTVTFCMTIQKQFVDGTTATPDLLGWGMSVTDSSGVTNQYTTDDVTGSIQICQLSVGTYTIKEDAIGALPPGCISAWTDEVTVNGEVQQPVSDTVILNWTTSSPVTIIFVNRLGCPG